MSEMRRWRDAGASAKEIDRMLSAAQPTRAMPASVRARLLGRMGGPPPPSPPLAPMLFVIAAAIGAVGLPVIVAVFHGRSPPVQAPAGPVSSAMDVREELPPPEGPSALLPEAPETLPQAPPPSAPTRPRALPPSRAARPLRPQPSAATSASELVGDTLAPEVALLERAHAQFDTDPASTLAILDQHARAFPAGKLAIERELLAIDALERLGKPADARSRAERALESARGTIYEARIRSHLLTFREAPF